MANTAADQQPEADYLFAKYFQLHHATITANHAYEATLLPYAYLPSTDATRARAYNEIS